MEYLKLLNLKSEEVVIMLLRNECYSKGELNARAEMLLQGHVINHSNMDNIKYIIDYVSKVLNKSVKSEEIIEKAFQYISDRKHTKIVGLSLNTLMGEMAVLDLVFKEDGENDFDIESEDGVFGYCYNYTCPDCSELGYSYFKRENGKLHRIA